MRATRAQLVVLLAIGGAWAVTIAGSVAGWRNGLGHDHVIEGGAPLLAGTILFLCGWLVMVAAMMLPSSLGAIRTFQGLAGVREAPYRLTGAFLAGYSLIWTLVGAAALGGDTFVHELSHRWSWLAFHPWTIAAGALVAAGWFELSQWSERCRRSEEAAGERAGGGPIGARKAIRLGADHGLVRLRECWPVMLLSFAFGMTSLVWMSALTLLMTLERSPRLAPRVALSAGVVFFLAAALILAEPSRVVPVLLGVI